MTNTTPIHPGLGKNLAAVMMAITCSADEMLNSPEAAARWSRPARSRAARTLCWRAACEVVGFPDFADGYHASYYVNANTHAETEPV